MNQKQPLEKRILKTIKYFDILDMPVTAVQIWRYLVVEDGSSRDKKYSLSAIKDSLQNSSFLKDHTESKWGYYTLEGRIHLLSDRLHRHILAAHKWKITRRIAKALMYLPFVKMIAGSGSLALNNTNSRSDLDLLVVARAKRIWAARLFLLLATQLTGRRRKYWDREAPDKLCLNHYVSSDYLELSVNRNIYTAVLYAYLVPISGPDIYMKFMKSNQSWMNQFVNLDSSFNLRSFHTLVPKKIFYFFSRLVEDILAEPVFDFIENLSESIQKRAIAKHTDSSNSGRVVVSNKELAFHPGSKEKMIVDKFRLISI